jgi:hypothetical protein
MIRKLKGTSLTDETIDLILVRIKINPMRGTQYHGLIEVATKRTTFILSFA